MDEDTRETPRCGHTGLELSPPVAGQVVFRISATGQCEIADEVLDEVATILWDQVVDKYHAGYADDVPYRQLPPEDKHWLRKVALETVRPVLVRLAGLGRRV